MDETLHRRLDPAIIARIMERNQVSAEDFVLFDDLAENVHAAVQAGLHGVVVQSPADAMQAFNVMGISKH
ncbi:MAG: hypothetical protein KDK91_06790 [Gammaproteobacteria bacterium]|nr:hypothetical protein [Gammaproteobacteria bacterium]